MSRKRRYAAVVLLWAMAACQPAPSAGPGPEAGADLSPDGPSEPPITMLVVLGDSVANGLGVEPTQRFDQLLVRNDDTLFPQFAGRDLSSRYSEVQLINHSDSGASSAETVKFALSVPPNPSGRTLVLLSLGPTEFADNLLAALDPKQVAAVSARVETNLDQIRHHFEDPVRYPGGAIIGLFNLYDPTDAVGWLPPLDGFDNIYCKLVAGFSHLRHFQLYNELRQAYTQKQGVHYIDLYQPFLGHGYYFGAPEKEHFHPQDPSLWYLLDCLHPNPRGHHEIRRIIWETLLESAS